MKISILDETTAGHCLDAGPFDVATSSITLRELIRARVEQEVDRFNQADCEVFRGLIQPEENERILNGVRQRPVLDPEKQFTRAVQSFEANGFLVIVDGRQITDLDDRFHLTPRSAITFLKLVPLMGG
jgi:hypothetical protein